MEEYLTVKEAAEVAKVHAATVRRWISGGLLLEIRRGGVLRVRRSDLDRFLSPETQGGEIGAESG